MATSLLHASRDRLEAALRSSIAPFALEVIALLERAGHEAWCVGGFVRDIALGHPSNDIDIATNATWRDAARICTAQGLCASETGVKHGTVTIYDPARPEAVAEVTTYRADGPSDDSRHPREVRFVRTIEEDLARRDFTMNALAYHPERGLLDCYGGLDDLRSGTIRCIGDPMQRFSEDALRILRGCRFVAQLGFTIDPATLQAMTVRKSLLALISKERIVHELNRLLTDPFVFDALMQTAGVLAFPLPELAAMRNCRQDTKYHLYDVYEHTAHVVQEAPPTHLARWAALCHDMGKPAASFYAADGVEHFYGHAHVSVVLAEGLLTRLGFNRPFIRDVLTLVELHDATIAPKRSSVAKTIARLEGRVDLFLALCDLKIADARAQTPKYGAVRIEMAQRLKEIARKLVDDEQALSVRDLAIGGHDLMDIGIPQGPQIGSVLKQLLDEVLDERVPNEQDALIERARELSSQTQ